LVYNILQKSHCFDLTNFNPGPVPQDGFVIIKEFLYILIENYTTFPLKSIPLIEVKPVALHRQQQHKNDDKHGYKTRDYQTVLS
jgi:hypothetical protein